MTTIINHYYTLVYIIDLLRKLLLALHMFRFYDKGEGEPFSPKQFPCVGSKYATPLCASESTH